MSCRIVYGKPTKYFVDGREVTKKEFDAKTPHHDIKEAVGVQTLMETSKAWPRKSDAFGVGANQKEKAEEAYKKLGVPTEMVPDGSGGYSALIRNNAHQRDLLKACKMHNRDGGFGGITG
jgi:hypothetical protein